MRTPIIVYLHNGHIVRATTPDEPGSTSETEVKHSPRQKCTGTKWLDDQKKVHEWTEPESAFIKCNRFEPDTRGKFAQIQRIEPAAINALEAIDQKRNELEAMMRDLRDQERQIISDAARFSTPITIEELREWGRVQQKRRDAAKRTIAADLSA